MRQRARFKPSVFSKYINSYPPFVISLMSTHFQVIVAKSVFESGSLFFLGGIFLILRRNFPNMEEDFPNIKEKFS